MPATVSRGATLFAVGVVHLMMPFMVSAVSVALPAIGRELGVETHREHLFQGQLPGRCDARAVEVAALPRHSDRKNDLASSRTPAENRSPLGEPVWDQGAGLSRFGEVEADLVRGKTDRVQ